MAEVTGTEVNKEMAISMALLHAVNTRNPSKRAYLGLFITNKALCSAIVVPHIRSLAPCPCHEAFLFGRV
jgi:hypothetical protein